LEVDQPYPLLARHFQSGVYPPVAPSKEKAAASTGSLHPDKDRVEVVHCSHRRSGLAVLSLLYVAAVGVALTFASESNQTIESINCMTGAPSTFSNCSFVSTWCDQN
jgi:hypothetical protein